MSEDRTAPNEFVRVSVELFDNPKLADIFDETEHPGVYVVWIYMLVRAKAAKHFGRIIATPARIARNVGITVAEAEHVLNCLVEAKSIVAVDDRPHHYQIRNWERWQSMSGAERTRKHRARRDAEKPENVTTMKHDTTLQDKTLHNPTEELGTTGTRQAEKIAKRQRDRQTVFDHWRQLEESVIGRSRRGDPLPGIRAPRRSAAKRSEHINARLDRFTVQELCNAITAYFQDDWFLGDNDRNTRFTEIKSIIGTDAKVERGLAKFEAQRLARPVRESNLVRPQSVATHG